GDDDEVHRTVERPGDLLGEATQRVGENVEGEPRGPGVPRRGTGGPHSSGAGGGVCPSGCLPLLALCCKGSSRVFGLHAITAPPRSGSRAPRATRRPASRGRRRQAPGRADRAGRVGTPRRGRAAGTSAAPPRGCPAATFPPPPAGRSS